MFSRYVGDYWTESERGEFATWIAYNPERRRSHSGKWCCRKVRWSRPGMGKRGGVRVIYFPALGEQKIWLLLIYAKGVRDTIPAHVIRAIRDEIEK